MPLARGSLPIAVEPVVGAKHFSRVTAGERHVGELEIAFHHDHSRWPTKAGGQEYRDERANPGLFGREKGLEGGNGRRHWLNRRLEAV